MQVGTFTLYGTVVAANPAVGNPNSAQLDLSNFNISGGSGSLTITAFDTGYSVIPGVNNSGNFVSSPQGNSSGVTVTNQSWYFSDPNQTGWTGTPPSGAVAGFGQPTSFGSTSQQLVNLGSDTFTLVEQVSITATGAGGWTSIDFATAINTPAPSGLILALTAVPLLGLGYWRHRRRVLA
jgi:hypothetical protein